MEKAILINLKISISHLKKHFKLPGNTVLFSVPSMSSEYLREKKIHELLVCPSCDGKKLLDVYVIMCHCGGLYSEHSGGAVFCIALGTLLVHSGSKRRIKHMILEVILYSFIK